MFNSTPLVNERSSEQRPSYSLRDLGLRRDNFNTAKGVYATVHSQADSTHGQAEHSDGSIVENGHRRERASSNIPMDDPPSVNVSDLRLGPVSREPLIEFALFSHYPEEEPNRAVPDEDATASSSATPVPRRSLVAPLELANHGDRRAPARPNTPVQSQTTGTPPLSDLVSHHPGRRASNSSLVHGSTPDNSTRNNTPGYDGRPTYLIDYLPEASPSSEDREAWTVGRIITPENADRANNTLTNTQVNSTNVISVMRNVTPQERETLGLDEFHGC
ncbi:hypothetical protein BDW02DRAFT_616601 [Decorospora gaudefroyi]|uniref:Uncharacterized protein n=1 Tax=Decorospora gaudefroyi TaxID=184978 RepID=A0A6A5JY50_9PLEO|nr:hypothetical protein BDW02DRAFT_616601 [Decorospora gaudefroyi]